MKKILQLLFICIIGTLFNPGVAGMNSKGPVVNIYGWFSSIPPEVINAFEKETGIHVNLDLVDSNEILEAKLLAGNSGYDIVVPTAWPYLARQVPAKLFHPIDKSRLKNYKEIDPQILKRLEKADPGNTFAIPFMWGLVAFAYDPDTIQKHIPKEDHDSWGLIYKPENIAKLKAAGTILIDDPTDLIFTMYIYLGIDLKDQSRATLNRVVDQLKKVRPAVKRFDFSLSADQLVHGEVCLAQQWVDHLICASEKNKRAKPIKIVLPREGTLMWIDVMTIPVDAPHKDEAYAFLDFLCRPEISAMITQAVNAPTAIPKARNHLSASVKNNPLIFPPASYMKKVYMAEVTSLQFQRQITRAYATILTGK